MLALALFVVGVVEYGLAAAWTRVVVSKRALPTAVVTFVNVMLWGFVITNLEPGNPWLLVVHGLGCAIGAAATCVVGVADEPHDVQIRDVAWTNRREGENPEGMARMRRRRRRPRPAPLVE